MDLQDNMDSVRSSQSQIEVPNDVKKIVEENCQRFNVIVNKTIPVDSNLEKELAKEDKKCTFMQYKIDDLNKRYSDLKETSATLQKCVRDQQMEIEKVSVTIHEQLHQLNQKFPADGISRYSNAVSIMSDVANYIENFKNILRNDIEEYDKKNAKIMYEKDSLVQRVNRIRELIAEKKNLEENLKTSSFCIGEFDLNSFEQDLSLLNQRYQTYQTLKSKQNALIAEKNELEMEAVDILRQSQKRQEISSETLNKFRSIMNVFKKECDSIVTAKKEIESTYYTTVKDSDLELEELIQLFKTLEDENNCKKQQADQIVAQNLSDRNDNNKILSQIEHLKSECLKSEKDIISFGDQVKISKDLLETIQQQICILEDATESDKLILEQLESEITLLKCELSSFSSELCDLDEESLKKLIDLERDAIQQSLVDQRTFDEEIEEMKHAIENLMDDNCKLENEIKCYQAERKLFEKVLKKNEDEMNEFYENKTSLIRAEINNTMDDLMEASSVLFEKQLLIDSVHKDIEQYTELTAEMQRMVLAADQKHRMNENEVARLYETLFEEKDALENRRKLLEDLKRNSFPKNKIPVNWFKSFEKQKQEFDSLVKQRLALEKQRNKLIIDIDSQTFLDDKHPSLNGDETFKGTSQYDLKSSMYDIFKERVRKIKP